MAASLGYFIIVPNANQFEQAFGRYAFSTALTLMAKGRRPFAAELCGPRRSGAIKKISRSFTWFEGIQDTAAP